jgi:hypothetical protein
METLLQEALRGCPALIDEPLKGLARQTAPEFTTECPSLFLKERAKRGLLKPEQTDIAVVREVVLGASDPLKVLVVEPVHIRMGIAWIPGAAIDIPTVHGPEVGDNIQICFCDPRRDIGIEEGRNQPRIHYPRLLKLYGQRERRETDGLGGRAREFMTLPAVPLLGLNGRGARIHIRLHGLVVCLQVI